jgi:hypothetical protein
MIKEDENLTNSGKCYSNSEYWLRFSKIRSLYDELKVIKQASEE